MCFPLCAFCSSFLDLENTPQGKAAHDDNNNNKHKKIDKKETTTTTTTTQTTKKNNNNNNNNNNKKKQQISMTRRLHTKFARGLVAGQTRKCVDLHAHTRPSDRHFPVPLLFQPATEVVLPWCAPKTRHISATHPLLLCYDINKYIYMQIEHI